MMCSHSPISSANNPIPKAKSDRKPLQPKNPSVTTPTIVDLKILKPKNASTQKCLFNDNDISNKENLPLFYQSPIAPSTVTPPAAATITTKKIDPLEMDQLDFSLAEELSALRKKTERLRLDKEKTEKILKDREAVLDKHMKKLQSRGEIQKHLETEVDRLYRLQELKLSCMKKSPIISLRDKEVQRKAIENLLTAGNGGICIHSQIAA